MKKAILFGAKFGALAGFSLALVNAVIVLIAAELSWPPDNQQIFDVFNVDFTSSYLAPLFLLLPVWLFLPTFIGGATASCFGFIYAKFELPKVKFIIVCLIVCFINTVIYFFLIQGLFVSERIGFSGHPLELIQASPMIESTVFLFPPIIYILAGFIVSQFLYKKFTN